MSVYEERSSNSIDPEFKEMPAESRPEGSHEVRITVLENHVGDIKSTLRELMGDVKQLVSVMQRQAEDRAAVERSFAMLEKVLTRVERVESRLEDEERQRLQDRIDQQDREINATNRSRYDARMLLLKVIGTVLATVAGSMLLYHFGFQT